MGKRKLYEWTITIAYIAMLLLCIYLNLSDDYMKNLSNILVSVAMFVIVGIIFVVTDITCFSPMNRILDDLEDATDKIKKDALNSHSYLWEPYQSNNVRLFNNPELDGLFSDFVFELNRRKKSKESYYKAGIGDYINIDMVDRVLHRNQLNQIAGVLTGLGILGTFIGLSLGLQNFNTGTTAEMTSSIEPLMEGIKVAFHTSIYGMIFSLVFNAVYKKKIYESECVVEEFVTAFQKYVLPDTTNDGMNQFVELQREQLEAIKNLPNVLSRNIVNDINPMIERMREIVVDFEKVATENQMEALDRIVAAFIREMNNSLGDTFTNIEKSENYILEMQNKNAEALDSITTSVLNSNGNIEAINNETSRLIDTLNQYSKGIQAVLDKLQNVMLEMDNREDEVKRLLAHEQLTLSEQKNTIDAFSDAINAMTEVNKNSNEHIEEAVAELSDAVYYMRRAVGKLQPAKGIRRRNEDKV